MNKLFAIRLNRIFRPKGEYMPKNRPPAMAIFIVIVVLLSIAVNFQSPVNAAHMINDPQAQPNIIHNQNDKSLGGKDQVLPPVLPNTVNDITGASFTMSCSSLSISGTASPASGYAGFRVWDDTINTTIVDSFSNVPGAPNYFAAISGRGFSITIPYASPQPLGHIYRARVYRAPTNAYQSWDGGAWNDHSWTCIGTIFTSAIVYCNFAWLKGVAYTAGGFVALRMWANGQTLVDSYVPGYPTNYNGIAGNGSWSVVQQFQTQPTGTSITVRVYHAPSGTTYSWDGGEYSEVTTACQQNLPVPTNTPTPTRTPTATPHP